MSEDKAVTKKKKKKETEVEIEAIETEVVEEQPKEENVIPRKGCITL